ncbi:MAG: M14 family zinc carboxypeptidase [Pseudomonadota bacterium]
MIVALAIASTFRAYAAPFSYFEPENATYDTNVTKPSRFIGHGLGEKPVRHDIMVAYLRSLAAQSDRLTVETIGQSHEGRPILFFVATAPENHQALTDLKANHLARLTEGEPDTDGPAVVWLNYGVHGAESAGMDAAIPTLYHLAAAQGDEVEAMLRETIILIVAIFNPDGHSRRINHVYAFGGDAVVTDRSHAQHNLWIQARTNHYWFDLNRDWLLLTQPESQAWIAKWHAWKPNVSADFHEMGSDSTYYFHPGEPRRKNPLIPDAERTLLSEIAKEHMSWLDASGELYTSEEGFDNFYIGKGSTYPSVNGSVGILFEAAAAAGGLVKTSNGLRSYAQNIRIHFNTSLTTIEGARKNRKALRDYQRGFFENARRAGAETDAKAYLVRADGDEAKLDAFLKLLRRHDILAYRLAKAITIDGEDYPAATSLIVPAAQSQFTMIRGVFERVREFEETVFYDVSGWTLPLAYDLTHAEVSAELFTEDLLGEPIERLTLVKEVPGEARYGYIFDWRDYYAPRTLHRFQDAGVLTRVLMAPKSIETSTGFRRFEQGSIFVPLNGQTASKRQISDIARRAAIEDYVDIFAINTGNAAPGVGDLGSRFSVRSLKKPKIALLFDNGVNRYSAGQLWHLLDKKMRIPTLLKQKNLLDQLPISELTHIVLPGGAGATLSHDQVDELDKWVKAGGVFIATRNAAIWAQRAFNLPANRTNAQDETSDTKSDDQDRYPYSEKRLRDAEHIIGGAIFGGDLDTTHPLGFGAPDTKIALMRAHPAVLLTPKDPVATVARYSEAPLLSGFASERREKEIAGTPMLAALRHGDGAIILFADDPSFRATFLGGDRLFLNAIFFGNAFDPSREGAGALDDH